jgi:hypothetical protein
MVHFEHASSWQFTSVTEKLSYVIGKYENFMIVGDFHVSLSDAGRYLRTHMLVLVAATEFEFDYIPGSMNFAASLKLRIYNCQPTHPPPRDSGERPTYSELFVYCGYRRREWPQTC